VEPKSPSLADEFALAEAALHDSAAIQFEECSRNAVKHRNFQKVFRFETFGARAFRDRSAGDALVGESACGTGNHTLAAGDAS